MKKFNGKAIYNPAGKAGEYSQWACNFYVGCSNGCEYCYCKKGILNAVMGMDKPQLKKCFRDEDHAIEVFEKELLQNKDELQKHGLFLSFTTDPMLPETIELTKRAMELCYYNCIELKILTKCTDWLYPDFKSYTNISFGFTLTGHDELEPNASTNQERIEAMRKLHKAGFNTWASIEPIIHLSSASRMIIQSEMSCNLFKIGLLSGKKFDKIELNDFVHHTVKFCLGTPVYFKDSLLKQAGIERESLPANCVSRNFNLYE